MSEGYGELPYRVVLRDPESLGALSGTSWVSVHWWRD